VNAMNPAGTGLHEDDGDWLAKDSGVVEFSHGRDGLVLVLVRDEARTQSLTVLVGQQPRLDHLSFEFEEFLVGSQLGDTNMGSDSVP
jgi:hypothetical protein